MNIREYFENLMLTEDFDEVMEMEYTIYENWQSDELDFESWAVENGIDINATEEVNGVEILVITLWGWDMEGD